MPRGTRVHVARQSPLPVPHVFGASPHASVSVPLRAVLWVALQLWSQVAIAALRVEDPRD